MALRSGIPQKSESPLLKCETVDRLKRAIDYRHQQLVESEKQEWGQRFAAPDPSDVCASVRINSTAAQAAVPIAPCVGYLPKRKSRRGRETQPRLA